MNILCCKFGETVLANIVENGSSNDAYFDSFAFTTQRDGYNLLR